jgi:hypothetical protein
MSKNSELCCVHRYINSCSEMLQIDRLFILSHVLLSLVRSCKTLSVTSILHIASKRMKIDE